MIFVKVLLPTECLKYGFKKFSVFHMADYLRIAFFPLVIQTSKSCCLVIVKIFGIFHYKLCFNLKVCCGRDQKPPTTALLAVTSPPSTQSKVSQATRSSTPVSSSTPSDRLALTVDRLAENRLSLCNLNNAERLLSSSTSLANLGGSQGLISGVGGKKWRINKLSSLQTNTNTRSTRKIKKTWNQQY